MENLSEFAGGLPAYAPASSSATPAIGAGARGSTTVYVGAVAATLKRVSVKGFDLPISNAKGSFAAGTIVVKAVDATGVASNCCAGEG